MKTGEVRMSIRFNRVSIAAHMKWIKYLAGDEFTKKIKMEFDSNATLARARKTARQIVQNVIYDAHQNPGRSYNLLRSPMSTLLQPRSGEVATQALYIDSRTTKSWAAKKGNADSNESYAIYFEKPELNTFIRRDLPSSDVIRYRPFFALMEEGYAEDQRKSAALAIDKALRYKKPR